ncbi:MAG: adventurous gliding motility protein CglE [Myxococcales bacterium]|nr:adventurous gliding motility protein CglE [Myxococcales bacterium]
MRRWTQGAVFALAMVAWVGIAGAQEAPPPAGAPPAASAVTPPAKTAADESEQIVFERLMGFYLEGRVGTFFTVAGARGWSNAQPFFGFEVGYDLTEALSMQLSYASGYQAANPLKYVGVCDPSMGDCSNYCNPSTDASCNDYHMDFSLTFVNLSADLDMWAGERWALEARLGGGIVIIQPSAKPDQPPVDGNAFAGVRFEYYTLLKHFTVGAEFDFYYVFAAGIPAFSGSASVVYNF